MKQCCCKENFSRKYYNNNNNNRFLLSNNPRFCRVITKLCQLQFSSPKVFPFLPSVVCRWMLATRSQGRKVTFSDLYIRWNPEQSCATVCLTRHLLWGMIKFLTPISWLEVGRCRTDSAVGRVAKQPTTLQLLPTLFLLLSTPKPCESVPNHNSNDKTNNK